MIYQGKSKCLVLYEIIYTGSLEGFVAIPWNLDMLFLRDFYGNSSGGFLFIALLRCISIRTLSCASWNFPLQFWEILLSGGGGLFSMSRCSNIKNLAHRKFFFVTSPCQLVPIYGLLMHVSSRHSILISLQLSWLIARNLFPKCQLPMHCKRFQKVAVFILSKIFFQHCYKNVFRF